MCGWTGGGDLKAFVTGATGFVGGHLVEALRRRGVEVRALVRASSDVTRLNELGAERVEAPLDDRAALERALGDAEVVLHLAALTRARSVAEFERVNVHGTATLLEAVRGAGARRFVYMSSMAAAGPSLGRRPVRPEDAPRPITAYGRSKEAGERVVLGGGAPERVVVRAPAVYGPRERDLFIYFRLAARGILPVPAGGERWVQLIEVRDLADALVRAAMEPGAAGVYHVADPTPYRWTDVARLISRAVGCNARQVRLPPGLIRVAAWTTEHAASVVGRASIFNSDKARELMAEGWLCDVSRAQDELGWTPGVELPAGLSAAAEWYRAQGWL